MGDWDSVAWTNGLNFEGDLSYEHNRNTNPILAFTFSVPRAPWLSDSPNLDDLLRDTKKAGNRAQDLYISIDPTNLIGLVRQMDWLKRDPARFDKFRIHIFTDPSQRIAPKKLLFHQVKLKDQQPGQMSFRVPFTKKNLRVPLPNRVYTLTYNDLELL